MRERTVAAIPSEHPLAKRSRISLRSLAGEPLRVLFPRETRRAVGFHDLFDRAPRRDSRALCPTWSSTRPR